MTKIFLLSFALFLCVCNINAQITCGTFKKLAVGSTSFSIAQKSDGTIWGWGTNTNSQLGLDNSTPQNSPQKIGSVTTWSSMSVGTSHTLAIRTNGTLWVWGSDAYGQLGNGSGVTDRATPTQVGSSTLWASAAAGPRFSMAVRTNGTLWGWGYNAWGQLGDGTEVDKESPTQIGSVNTWKTVSIGDNYMIALRTNGTLWSSGENYYGKLGRNLVDNKATLGQIGSATDWASIASGTEHNFAIKTNGTLWAWGRNTHGQLGDGTGVSKGNPVQVGTASDWESVSAGGYFGMAIKKDGTLWAWGDNTNGQLGETSQNAFQLIPIQVGTANDWMSVSCGINHSMAIKKDGTLWTWGVNSNGQLGDNSTTNRNAPVQISSVSLVSLTTVSTSQTLPVSNTTTYYNVTDCNNLIAVVAPQGTTPVSGNTTAKVWIQSEQPLQYVKRHYEITPGTNAANATGRITLYFTQAEFNAFNAVNVRKLPTGPTDEANKANLIIEKRPGVSSNNTGLPETYTGTAVNIYPTASEIIWNAVASRWEVSFNVTGFSGLYVKNSHFILPVTLLHFTTTKTSKSTALLKWATSSEQNNKGFYVERSFNGTEWNTIGFVNSVAANGNSSTVLNYQFEDSEPLKLINYYRLKQIDFDETYQYSAIRQIQVLDQSLISLAPNPAKDYLWVSGLKGNETIQVMDLAGKLLMQEKAKTGKHQLLTNHLANGIYHLVIIDNNYKRSVYKFIK
mgnify:CR=1 FL=1